jgi:hypothetical protein
MGSITVGCGGHVMRTIAVIGLDQLDADRVVG